MKVIELLGPSGVGKTFLYSKLVDKSISDRSFLNAKDAQIKAALSCRLKMGLDKKVFYKALLAIPAFKVKQYGIAVKLLDGLVSDFNDQYHLSYSILSQYLTDFDDKNEVDKRMRAFKKRADNLCLLDSLLKKDDVLVLDEGPLHYHHGLKWELSSKYGAEGWKNDKIINPAAVISCELDSDEVFARAVQRRRKGINTYSHRSLSESELYEYIKRNVLECKAKVDFLERIGVPVLRVNTGGAIWGNIKEVRGFVSSFST